MNHAITKIVGAAAGVTLLAPGAVAFGDTVEAAAPDASGATWSHVEGASSTVESPVVNVPNVSGGFSYQQSVVTPNWKIAEVFQKAANALCNATTELTVTAAADWSLTVSGDVENAYTATLGELAADDEQTTLMGCSCAANTPGGAAVINAEVTGVPLATIVERAQPLPGVNTVTLTSEDGYSMSVPFDYVMARTSILSYMINDEGLSASVGGTNQLWIDSTAAKYFTRNIVSIELTAEDEAPAVPGSEDAPENQYANRPNVGITGVS